MGSVCISAIMKCKINKKEIINPRWRKPRYVFKLLSIDFCCIEISSSFKFGNKYPAPLRYEFSGSGKPYVGLNWQDSDDGFNEDGPIELINYCPYCGAKIEFIETTVPKMVAVPAAMEVPEEI